MQLVSKSPEIMFGTTIKTSHDLCICRIYYPVMGKLDVVVQEEIMNETEGDI